MRITITTLRAQVEELKELTGLNLELDYSSAYGGYRLVQIKKPSRAHSNTPWNSCTCSRRSARDMYHFLSEVIWETKYNQK